MKYRTQSNFIFKGEVFVGHSQTIPDMTLPLRTLLERYTRGQSVATFQPVYLGDEEFPDFERMTPQERVEYARNLTRSVETLQTRIAEHENQEDIDIEDDPQSVTDDSVPPENAES